MNFKFLVQGILAYVISEHRMSFTFSQDLLAETGALTQPMVQDQDLQSRSLLDTQDLQSQDLAMEELQGHWQGQESRVLLSQGDSGYSSQAHTVSFHRWSRQ